MELFDPTAPGQEQVRTRAPALANLDDLTIGLLSNGKAKADVLIRATAQRLINRFGGKYLDVKFKKHASEPASTELLTNLSHECDYLITAAGD
ncbi:MAG: hypothetical protein GKR90_06570 [Pseudomonadales bacterium]|nr:hypothetical protein [Pseudomonadales bacterium]